MSETKPLTYTAEREAQIFGYTYLTKHNMWEVENELKAIRKAHEQTREIARELAAALEESAHLGCWCQWAAGHSQKCQKLQAALAKYHAQFPEAKPE